MMLKTKRFIISFSFNIIKRAQNIVSGYMNRTTDGFYTVFLDYDNYKLNWVKDEIDRLANDFNIDHWFIFQSSRKSFHAVSLCKLTPRSYVELLNESGCDSAFKNVPRFTTFRSWVLRYTSKAGKNTPRLIECVKYDDINSLHEKSNAHLKFMLKTGLVDIDSAQYMFGIKDNFDSLTEIELIKYKTGSKVII